MSTETRLHRTRYETAVKHGFDFAAICERYRDYGWVFAQPKATDTVIWMVECHDLETGEVEIYERPEPTLNIVSWKCAECGAWAYDAFLWDDGSVDRPQCGECETYVEGFDFVWQHYGRGVWR